MALVSEPLVDFLPGCDFCEIANEIDEARVVFRSEKALAFFPLEPATLGHTLLIPRMHRPDIYSLGEDLAAELGLLTARLATAVRRAMGPDGLNVIQSNGEAATQSVRHLHIHIVPRWTGDPIGPIWPPETSYSESQKDSAWESLRAQFSSGGELVSPQPKDAAPNSASGP